jgi:AcrR family transcriptional regulator
MKVPVKPSQRPRLARGEAILRATLEELASSGYRSLSIEDVAAKAGVNKTTVYRRWPAKKDLVQAALASVMTDRCQLPDTGSMRRDLQLAVRSLIAFSSTLKGQGIFQIRVLESSEPELETICRTMRDSHESGLGLLVRRGIERGELASDTDAKLFLQTLVGALHWKLLLHHERVDDGLIARVIDLLILGATPRSGAPPHRARKRP